ncbi:DUF5687 family protein [Myroides pelagicus]|uniref:Uncharacterized protein n=1 Tax=Myroides pelagicus TaxID=270914 RepID=A0A7K1GJ72_9FLAO|nr:DUF5687 family protein [Myroides pelagicus]MEC4113652.1 DUF5687 family protein [Myroides pelagicus]MTH28848.1 hypothetical protein [Myroides pelagicus]
MIQKLLVSLQKKQFSRRAKSGIDIWVAVLKWFAFGYLALIFLILGIGINKIVLKEFDGQSIVDVVSRFFIFYLSSELIMRYFFQKMPVAMLKHYLVLSIKKKEIVSFFVKRTFLTPFNFVQLFFYIPLLVNLLRFDYNIVGSIFWVVSLYLLSFIMHLLVVLIENNKTVFIAFVIGIIGFGAITYYEIFDFTSYIQHIFSATYYYPFLVVLFVGIFYLLYRLVLRFYLSSLYIDVLDIKKDIDRNVSDISWVEKFGKHSLFIKNDVKLILRNKRAKSVILMSIVFVFYAFIFDFGFRSASNSYGFQVFLGYFVTGGFMMLFGQYVPSWDSSHYSLILTQKVSFHEYLESKWVMISFATLISILLCSVYLIKGLDFYLLIVSMGIYNIGISSFLVLYTGIYTRFPIDLTSAKNIMGDKKAFNARSFVMVIPQLLIPVVIFYCADWVLGYYGALGCLALCGVLGIVFRKYTIRYLADLNKKEKYNMIIDFKKK